MELRDGRRAWRFEAPYAEVSDAVIQSLAFGHESPLALPWPPKLTPRREARPTASAT